MDVIYIAVSAPWKMEMELFVPWLSAERGCGTVADCEKCLGNALNSVSCNWDNAWVNYGDEPAEAKAWPGLAVAGMQSTWQTLLLLLQLLRRPVEIFMKTPASSRVELSFWGNAAIWISLRCMKLILFGATLSATNYLRQLSADWSYLRLLYAPHFFLPLSLSPSRSLCVSHNKQRQHRLQLGVYVIFV